LHLDLLSFPTRRSSDLDRFIEAKAISSRRRFLDVITHPSDDILGSVCVPDDTSERFPGLIQIRRIHFQETHPRTSVVAGGRDRIDRKSTRLNSSHVEIS